MKNNLGGLICPICSSKFCYKDNFIVCKNGHSFDLAKEGYCNLILPNKKHSSVPGDSKQMMVSRYEFLEKEFYKNLSDNINAKINNFLVQKSDILDAGCGYGYYLNHLQKFRHTSDNYYGVDISKYAVSKASKLNKEINYFVASVFDLPFEDKSFDLVLSIFSPFAMQEYERVCKDNGYLVVASPAEKHLWELKKYLYGENAQEKFKNKSWDNWTIVDKYKITNKIFINNCKDLKNLFYMTPYCYKTSENDIKKLDDFKCGEFTTDFYLTIYKKSKSAEIKKNC